MIKKIKKTTVVMLVTTTVLICFSFPVQAGLLRSSNSDYFNYRLGVTQRYLFALAARVIDDIGGIEQIRNRGYLQDWRLRYESWLPYPAIVNKLQKARKTFLPHDFLPMEKDMQQEAENQWLSELDNERDWARGFKKCNNLGKYFTRKAEKLHQFAWNISSLFDYSWFPAIDAWNKAGNTQLSMSKRVQLGKQSALSGYPPAAKWLFAYRNDPALSITPNDVRRILQKCGNSGLPGAQECLSILKQWSRGDEQATQGANMYDALGAGGGGLE